MKFSLHLNQKQAIALGINNINQALIFDLLTGCAAWAKTVVIDDVVYYWVARQVVCNELEILNLKPDTVYRHLKKLDELGVIEHVKHHQKDCIKITRKGASYYVGNESELPVDNSHSTMSEMNPKNGLNSEMNPNHYIGNESENNSDLNPTYQTTNIISLNTLSVKACDDFIKIFPADDFKLSQIKKNWPRLDKNNCISNHIDLIKKDILAKTKSDRRWLAGFVSSPENYLKQELWLEPLQPVKQGDGFDNQLPEFVVPKSDEHMAGWALKWKYSPPRSGEQFNEYRGRLNAEVQKRRFKQKHG